MLNLNDSFNENLDDNFTRAVRFYLADYSHKQLISFLKNGDITQKQIAALRISKICSIDDAQAFLDNLTGQDGKVREAVSSKILELCNTDNLQFFVPENCYKIFLEALTDINGNICRNIVSVLGIFRNNAEFCTLFCPALLELIFHLLDIAKNINYNSGKYKVNKDLFKLYWCLEAVYVLYDKLELGVLKQIILSAKNIPEYTIREKAAKILSQNIDEPELNLVRIELKNDENYYVRRF